MTPFTVGDDINYIATATAGFKMATVDRHATVFMMESF